MNQVTVKERPILFSTPMVRAILEGRKTQTRRIVKPVTAYDSWEKRGSFIPLPTCERTREGHYKTLLRLCPYGQPCDRLWVRETFVKGHKHDGDHLHSHDENDNELPKRIWFRASDPDIIWMDDDYSVPVPWKPSIHMKRVDSRIDLEVVKVRVERLQDISDEDCLAEGVYPVGGIPHKRGFQEIWERVNGDGSWVLNPWVWCIEFKRVRP